MYFLLFWDGGKLSTMKKISTDFTTWFLKNINGQRNHLQNNNWENIFIIVYQLGSSSAAHRVGPGVETGG